MTRIRSPQYLPAYDTFIGFSSSSAQYLCNLLYSYLVLMHVTALLLGFQGFPDVISVVRNAHSIVHIPTLTSSPPSLALDPDFVYPGNQLRSVPLRGCAE